MKEDIGHCLKYKCIRPKRTIMLRSPSILLVYKFYFPVQFIYTSLQFDYFLFYFIRKFNIELQQNMA